jgi:serine/threonine protein kinase
MSSTSFEAPTLEALSELLPAYEFDSFIAQGGMGAVYKARQKALDRDVAVKILPRELGDDPDFRRSFETEARAMARLNHPNLIGVYDSGDLNGMLYIVMEYVNGKSLYHSAYNLAVEPEQAAAIVKGISDGLAHAHENGVIHRDIKPANILLTAKAEPKIGDFGLARPANSDHPGLIMGTPGYTAPEIYEDPEHADQKTDIYAVGVILYELLTGHRPEDDEELPVPSSVVGCDKKLDKIWAKATNHDPAQRYDSAEEMAHDLEGWAIPDPPTQALRTMHRPPRFAGQAPVAAVAAPRRAAPSMVVVRKARKNETDWSLLVHILMVGVVLVAIFFGWKAYQQAKAEDEKRKVPGKESSAPPKPSEAPVPEKKPEPQPKPAPLPGDLEPPPTK